MQSESYFFIQSDNLCFLKGMFSPFISNEVTGMIAFQLSFCYLFSSGLIYLLPLTLLSWPSWCSSMLVFGFDSKVGFLVLCPIIHIFYHIPVEC